jgi:flagellar biogenesis protein FliO
MNREQVIWLACLCCAVTAVAISTEAACAQASVPFENANPGGTGQTSSGQAGGSRAVTTALFQTSQSPENPFNGASGIGFTSTPSDAQQSASARRKSTPLAPRSSVGLPDRRLDDSESSHSGNFGSILIALGFVVVLMLGIAKVIQRRNPFAVTGVPREAIDVLGRRTVDPRNSIYIVRVGPKILLLGSSANGLTALSEIEDPIEVASMANVCRAASDTPPTDLVTWFRGLWGRRSSRGEVRSFEDRFGERLMSDAQLGETGNVTSVDIARRQEVRRV